MSRIFLVVIFLMACSQNEEIQQATGETGSLTSGLPPGAVLEDYRDETGLAKVVVKDEAGAILQEGILKDGKREGNWTEYHPGGFVKSVTSYVNDVKEGLCLEIIQNGQLARRYTYHNDLKNGDYKEYFYSTVKEERFYQNDKLEGTVKIYYDNGKLMEEGNYKNNIRDGISKWYDQEGHVTIEYEYADGQLIKK